MIYFITSTTKTAGPSTRGCQRPETKYYGCTSREKKQTNKQLEDEAEEYTAEIEDNVAKLLIVKKTAADRNKRAAIAQRGATCTRPCANDLVTFTSVQATA